MHELVYKNKSKLKRFTSVAFGQNIIPKLDGTRTKTFEIAICITQKCITLFDV